MVELNENYIGSVCEMSNTANELVCIGKISGLPTMENEFNLSVKSTVDSFPVLAHRTVLKIHIRNAKLDSVFLTGRLEICKADLMRFDDLQLMSQSEKRDTFRVTYKEKMSFYNKGEYVPAGVLAFRDISLGGFMCCSMEQLSFNKLYTVELPLSEGFYLFTFQVVRNLPIDERNVHTYGCQFIDVGEKQLDALARFVFTLQKENINQFHRSSR